MHKTSLLLCQVVVWGKGCSGQDKGEQESYGTKGQLSASPCRHPLLPKGLARTRATAHNTAICASCHPELVVGIKGAINVPLNRATSFCVCLLWGSRVRAPAAFVKCRSAVWVSGFLPRGVYAQWQAPITPALGLFLPKLRQPDHALNEAKLGPLCFSASSFRCNLDQ